MATPNLSLRASDHEREQVVRLLGEHTAAGRLSIDELDERVAAAYAAATLDQLDTLVRDLPGGIARMSGAHDTGTASSVPVDQPAAAPGPHHEPARSPTAESDPSIRACHTWTRWAAVGAICLAIWATTSVAAGGALYFWPLWVIGPWAIVLFGRRMAPHPRAGATGVRSPRCG